jgi:hypothetical protein
MAIEEGRMDGTGRKKASKLRLLRPNYGFYTLFHAHECLFVDNNMIILSVFLCTSSVTKSVHATSLIFLFSSHVYLFSLSSLSLLVPVPDHDDDHDHDDDDIIIIGVVDSIHQSINLPSDDPIHLPCPVPSIDRSIDRLIDILF